MGRNIAIVEDEPLIRANYVEALNRFGYDTRGYGSRQEASSAFAVRLPELVIIDIGLGDEPEGGFDLCRELRAKSATLPIIFLTARDSDFDVISGLRLGADDYLSKDTSLHQLAARIAALFRRIESLKAPASSETVIGHGPLKLESERMRITWNNRGSTTHRYRILDGAHARALPGSRKEPRSTDARSRTGGGRCHDHFSHQAHPQEVHRRRA